MSTYYDLLKTQSDARREEIQNAYDKQYNSWRRLVNHHDPAVVEKANKTLRLLEEARQTLLNSASRDAYNKGIGIGGAIDGLADPDALFASMKQPSISNNMPSPIIDDRKQKRTDVWICPKCKSINAIRTPFCTSCGNTIGQECVGCGNLTELSNPYCPYCGINKEEEYRVLQEKMLAELIKQEKELLPNLLRMQGRQTSWAGRNKEVNSHMLLPKLLFILTSISIISGVVFGGILWGILSLFGLGIGFIPVAIAVGTLLLVIFIAENVKNTQKAIAERIDETQQKLNEVQKKKKELAGKKYPEEL